MNNEGHTGDSDDSRDFGAQCQDQGQGPSRHLYLPSPVPPPQSSSSVSEPLVLATTIHQH